MVNLREQSITRDVFCAALALKLPDEDPAHGNVIEWASVAMTCFAEDYRSQLIPPVPTKDRVDRELAKSDLR